MADIAKLQQAIGDLNEKVALGILQEVVDSGGGEAQGAIEACRQGMTIVGDKFETGEYYVSDLIFAGDLMKSAVEILKPVLARDTSEVLGRMIICTVQKDMHDIGKNIVKTMLVASGIEVIDLGFDVAPEVIVETAKAEGIKVIGLSGVLTVAIDSMINTVNAFAEAGMRNDVKIIIGGAPISEAVCVQVGADNWATNPQKAVEVCSQWLR